jgi:signal transduction histidine kinase
VSSRRADALIGIGALALGVGVNVFEDARAAGYVAAVVLAVALAAGRRHPRAAWIVTAATILAVAPFEDLSDGVALVAVAQAFYAGRLEGRWWGIAGLVALVGALEVNGIGTDAFVPAALLPGAAWAAGRALRDRELVAAQLAERAHELDEEREAHAALSVRYERARIASELHDIVAHAISVMVIQASAGQRLAARDPEATAEAFDAIADAARQAEQDMGRLVALLGDEGAIGPAPDLALVEELVARASGSGLDVTLRLEGEREGLPAPVIETAYRVVQEGLTNALRYAAGAAVTVLVRGDRQALVVSVVNAPTSDEVALTGAGTGTGLQGLLERVGACGGTLAAGPTPEAGWQVTARMPRLIPAGSGSRWRA